MSISAISELEEVWKMNLACKMWNDFHPYEHITRKKKRIYSSRVPPIPFFLNRKHFTRQDV